MRLVPRRSRSISWKSLCVGCAIAGALLVRCTEASGAESGPASAVSARIANAALRQPAAGAPAILLNGIGAQWYNTANGEYYRYLAEAADADIGENPSGPAGLESTGSTILLLCRVTQKQSYYQSATALYERLLSGKIPTAEMAYDTEPFLAAYAAVFHRDGDFARIAEQMEHVPRNSGARDLGFRMMTLVDALPYFPQDSPARAAALADLRHLAATALRTQAAGLWSDTQTAKTSKANADLAASAMVTYSLARGVRLGWLSRRYGEATRRAWAAIASRVQGLSPEEAASDKITAGALLLAANEMELAPLAEAGQGSKVLVDGWYNSEKRAKFAGQTVLFHYKWDDYSNPGYSLFGHIFRSYGVETDSLDEAPTVARLKGARFYLIVSPDNQAKVPDPHFMTESDAAQIASWVKQGGVLVMLENDPANADIQHMDILADRFGLHFNDVLVHHVVGDDFAMGRIDVTQPGPLFRRPYRLYMKDTCSLKLAPGAVSLLRWKGDILMGFARYGRGTAVAVTDPWLYNEYTDGRKLPAEYENFAAGSDFVRWLLQQK